MPASAFSCALSFSFDSSSRQTKSTGCPSTALKSMGSFNRTIIPNGLFTCSSRTCGIATPCPTPVDPSSSRISRARKRTSASTFSTRAARRPRSCSNALLLGTETSITVSMIWQICSESTFHPSDDDHALVQQGRVERGDPRLLATMLSGSTGKHAADSRPARPFIQRPPVWSRELRIWAPMNKLPPENPLHVFSGRRKFFTSGFSCLGGSALKFLSR